MRILAALLAIATVLVADETKKTKQPEQLKDKRHEIKLRGGSVLVGELQLEEWRVTTAFGPLTIPAKEMNTIRFGRLADKERYQKVEKLIGFLSSEEPEQRDAAEAQLAELGVYAAPDLKKLAKSHADPEVRKRCDKLLKRITLQEKYWPEDKDVIDTKQFSLVGTVAEKSFKIYVEELGEIVLQRKDVLEVRRYAAAETYTFQVKGHHNYQQQWFKTNITIKPGTVLKIRTTGQIHMPNWGNAIFPPDGLRNYGQINGIWQGTLVGRVNNGRYFKIGSSYEGSPTRTGKLELAVLMNARNQPSTGAFKVAIEVTKGRRR